MGMYKIVAQAPVDLVINGVEKNAERQYQSLFPRNNTYGLRKP